MSVTTENKRTSSSMPKLPTRGRSRSFMKNPWDTFLGDCSVVDKYLLDKPVRGPWFAPHFANAFLRSVGQLAFVNNPLGGALVLAILFAANWKIALGATLGGVVATMGEMVLMLQDWSLMRSGVAPFNGVLIGAILQSLTQGLLHNYELQPVVIGIICLGSLSSIYLCSALNNFLSRCSVPYLALPFNLVAICSLMLLKNSTLALEPDSDGSKFHTLTSLINITSYGGSENTIDNSTLPSDLDWALVFKGVVCSFGQIWGLNGDVLASIFLCIAIFMASPLTLILGGIGALLGTLGGATLSLLLPELEAVELLQEVYAGVWGFNSFLSMSALSCVFFAFNHASLSLGLVNVGATVFTQFGLRCVLYKQHGLPVLTLPFVLPTMLLILTSDERAQLGRIHEAMGYPERHAYRRYTLSRQSRLEAAEKAKNLMKESKEAQELTTKLMEANP